MLANSLIKNLRYFARRAKPLPKINNSNDQYINQQQIKNKTIDFKNVNIFSQRQKKNQMNNNQKNQIQSKLNQQFQAQIRKKEQQYETQLKLKIKQKITEQLRFNPSYEGQDPTPSKLVNRPNKGVVWGLGGQLMLASKKVQLEGLKDNIDQIIQFLELNQVKNIYVHDFHKENPQKPETNKRRFHILGSCYSARHCWKTSTQLKNAFNLYSGKSKLKKRGKKYDPIYAQRTGGKDQQFCMVDYKDYSISLMTQQQREAMDLQWKWNNQVPQQTLDKYMRAKQNKKGRRNQFQDFD